MPDIGAEGQEKPHAGSADKDCSLRAPLIPDTGNVVRRGNSNINGNISPSRRDEVELSEAQTTGAKNSAESLSYENYFEENGAEGKECGVEEEEWDYLDDG
jgi:hypothetical protein